MLALDRIFVNVAARDSEVLSRFRRAYPSAPLVEVEHEAEVRQILLGLDKQAVYVGPRGEQPPPLHVLGLPGGIQPLDPRNATGLAPGVR